jgi:hypothetical protein
MSSTSRTRPARSLIAGEQGEAQAQAGQRCAQVVRQAGEHLAALGGGAGQLAEHRVVALGQPPHLARTLRRHRARRAVAGRRDGLAEARQWPDDAAHEEAGDEQDGGQRQPPETATDRVGSACGSKRGGGSTSHQRSLPAMKPIHRPLRCPGPPWRSSTGSPSARQVDGKAAGERESAARAVGTPAAVGRNCSPCSPASARSEPAGVIVEPRQDDLQQTHLAGDQLHRLVDVRTAAEMAEEREGGDSATAMTAITSSTVRRRARRERSAASFGVGVAAPASGTKT